MDFEGQKLAEKLYQSVIVLFAVVGFVWGYYCEQFVQTIYILGAGVLLACLLVIPPWPMFMRHPLQWQKPSETAAKAAGTKKKEKRN
eukprot:Em0008g671a